MSGNLLKAPHIYQHEQDAMQGQFLKRVQQVWIQNFPSLRPVAIPSLKKPVCPTIYP